MDSTKNMDLEELVRKKEYAVEVAVEAVELWRLVSWKHGVVLRR